MHHGSADPTAAEVRVLVGQQFPARRALPVRPLPLQDTVNAGFRLRTQFVARLPLLPGEVDVIRIWLQSNRDPPVAR